MANLTQREARRKRNREDFERVRADHLRGRKTGGVSTTPGNTLHEHLEDQMKIAVNMYRRHKEAGNVTKATTARGIVRGLAVALLAYENSYALGDLDAVKAIEKEFLNG